MLPVGPPDALDALGGAGARARAAVNAAPPIGHARRLTWRSTALGLGSTTRSCVGGDEAFFPTGRMRFAVRFHPDPRL